MRDRGFRSAMVVGAIVPVAAWLSVRPADPPPVRAGRSAPALHVSGGQVVDAGGAPVQLDGVNRSGTEYACAQGWGIFDGPSDTASVAAIAS